MDTNQVTPPPGFKLKEPPVKPPPGFKLKGATALPPLKVEEADPQTLARMEAVEAEARQAQIPSATDVIWQNVGSLVSEFTNEALLGIPKQVYEEGFTPSKVHWTQDISGGVGKFAGFALGAPVKLGSKGARLALKGLKMPLQKIAGKFGGRVAGQLAEKAIGLGVASAISDVADIKGMPKRFLGGAALGSIFGVTDLSGLIKTSPFIGQMVRQVGSRTLAGLGNMYSPDIYKRIATGDVDPQLAQEVFDELLFTWFSRKGTKPDELFKDLQKIKVEVEKNKYPLKVWTPYDTPEYRETMKKIPAQYVVTGSGETIPIELFHQQPKISDLLKIAPSLKKPPELEAHKPTIPEKPTPPQPGSLAETKAFIKQARSIQKRYKAGEDITKLAEESREIPSGIMDKIAPDVSLEQKHQAMLRRVGTEEPYIQEVQKEIIEQNRRANQERLEKEIALEAKTKVETETELPTEAEQIAAYKKAGKIEQLEPGIAEGAESLTKPMGGGGLEAKGIGELAKEARESRGKPRGAPKVKSEEDLRALYGHKPTPEKKVRTAKIIKEVPEDVVREFNRQALEEKIIEAEKLPGPEIEWVEFHSGIHIPRMLKSLDKTLEKHYGTVEPGVHRQAEREIIEAKKEVDKPEKRPVFGKRVLTTFEGFGKAGERLKDMSLNYIKNRAQMEQRGIYELYQASRMVAKDIPTKNPFKKIKMAGERLFDLLERKAEPASEGEKEALKILDKQMADVARMAQELDLKILTPLGEREWKPIKNYAPVIYEPKGFRQFMESPKFKHMRDKYVDMIARRNWPEIFEENPERAREVAQNYFDEVRKDLKTKPSGHLERPRLLNESALEKLRLEWEAQHPDKPFPLKRQKSLKALSQYIISSYERLAWIEQFGKDVAAGKGWYIPEKLNELRSEFKSGYSERYVMDFFDKYLRDMAPLDTRTTRLLKDIKTLQLTKLAFAFIPNSAQWLTNTVSIVDSKSSVGALWDTIKYAGLAGKKLKQQQRDYFSKTGASTFKHAFQQAMMENPAKTSIFADITMKLHLFSGTEFFNALFSAQAGARYTRRISERLYKGRGKSWRSPFYRAELKKMGLSEKDVETIIKDGPLTEKDVTKLADASFHMRRYTQFLSDAFHLPKTWSTKTGRLFTQFKNFAYNQTALIYSEGIKEAIKFVKSAGREGSITKLTKMAITIPLVGALITKLKKELYPKLGIHFYEELLAGKSRPFKVMIYAMNAGGLGIASDIIMSAGFGKAGLIGLLGGPTVSDFSEFWEALSKTGDEIWTAITKTNARYLGKRAKTVATYWLRVAERMSPDARIAIQNFFKDYRNIKSAANWSNLVKDAYREYKELYKLKSPAVADDFWDAFMNTQGKEYEEIFNRTPKKPTPKEIDRWWEEIGKHPSERMTMPGTKKEGKKEGKEEMGEFWY